MDVWLIADTHFNHANIIKYENRPFTTTCEMNEVLIKNWNNSIKENDLVYHLGDVCFGKSNSVEEIISQLRGQKYLLMGNHDRRKSRTWWSKKGFVEVYKKPIDIIVEDMKITLSHEPVFKPETLNVHGHVHSKIHRLNQNIYKCVSVECTEYRPVHISEIKKWMLSVS